MARAVRAAACRRIRKRGPASGLGHRRLLNGKLPASSGLLAPFSRTAPAAVEVARTLWSGLRLPPVGAAPHTEGWRIVVIALRNSRDR